MMILFGGGDGGGIYIDAEGRPHRIPPWTPDIMAGLKAASAVLKASHTDLGLAKELSAVAETLTTKLIPSLAKTGAKTGSLASGSAVAFLDDDGGFTCGSTGNKPIPLPHGPQGGLLGGLLRG